MKSLSLRWTMIAAGLLLWWNNSAHSAEFPDFIQLVERYSDAVVSINVSVVRRSEEPGAHPPIPKDHPLYEYFKHFFEQIPEMPPGPLVSIGSGFILSEQGYIVTNAHVIEDTDNITVGLSDRRELPAKVIGQDARSDIALLKIEAIHLPTVKIGDSRKLKVGQWVLAIGSPFGLEHTATQGIISALGRSLPRENYVPFIQTDAAINPGNSGGPLFNLDGEVIGVNAQISTRTGGYQGVSFAIPINVAMDVVEQLRVQGKVSRGWLGVLIQEVTPELAQSFGLERPHGALVGQVIPDSPALKAGVKVGDIIIAFNGEPINRSSELPPMVGRVRPGISATLTLIRDDAEKVLTVPIEELPDNPLHRAALESSIGNRLHIRVKDLPPEQGEEGVMVEEVNPGPAASGGIRPGDIIVRIDNKNVKNAAQFEMLETQLPADKPLPVLVRRDNHALFLAITIPAQ